MLPAVNGSLPGIARNRRWRLSDDLESDVAQALHREDGHVVIAMAPTTVKAVLSAVRDAVNNDGREMLIVGEPHLRSPVNQLLKLEFNRMPVLSAAEVEQFLGAPPRAEVIARAG